MDRSVRQRHLSVQELTDLERANPRPAPKVAKHRRPTTRASRIAERSTKREAIMNLGKWIKEHRFLRASTLEEGEVSMALLILWESDHGSAFPGPDTLQRRLSTFSKRLSETVEADDELKSWLSSKTLRRVLSPGLVSGGYLFWTVCIDAEVGDAFLSKWKEYLASLVSRPITVQGLLEGGREATGRAKGSSDPKRNRRRKHRQRVGARTLSPNVPHLTQGRRGLPSCARRSRKARLHNDRTTQQAGVRQFSVLARGVPHRDHLPEGGARFGFSGHMPVTSTWQPKMRTCE